MQNLYLAMKTSVFLIILSAIVAKLKAFQSINSMCPTPATLPDTTKKQLEKDLLKLFDVEPYPKSSKKFKYSTKFMIDLYEHLNRGVESSNRLKRWAHSRTRVREDEIAKAAISDVVLSMACVNRKADGIGQRQKLVFSMRSVPKSAALVSAELKLYQSRKFAQNVSQSMYLISVYKPFQFTTKFVKMKKLGEKITSSDYTGWLSIDISYMFLTWLEYRQQLQDLYISVQPYVMEEGKEVNPAVIGIIFQNEFLENEPFIVAFLRANNVVHSRLPRDVNIDTRGSNAMEILMGNGKCSIHSMRVSFDNLGWSDWVIAPEGYTTSYCRGTCDFPLSRPLKATNHAIIQSLMHLKHGSKYPKPCCTPIEASQLSVLFKQKENTILKNYKNMIVRSCGCQ